MYVLAMTEYYQRIPAELNLNIAVVKDALKQFLLENNFVSEYPVNLDEAARKVKTYIENETIN